ncbi:SAGA histone acetylase and TREX-2 complexes component [Apiotrichum porosum]|uniref:SAGA histone acetylase and TREX-2 complexes component n=1 Tax=Apiotrichum porosum TaxID=105984 RepID=A0A427YB84_9TREE|nr:SAGA histone acetylase and TREX-2 complexes component [Apiotrichum porosum]RSH88227.1 SAGA histone acetylase and TREX-2 complexes component [Apiotrichum porosum]
MTMADESTLDTIRKRLLETGDWDRISRLLRQQLEESGFDDELKDLAKETARKQGAPSLAKLVADVTPAANATVLSIHPPRPTRVLVANATGLVNMQVREAVVREIEIALEREVERV